MPLDKSGYRRSPHAVHAVRYHFVFIAKRRRPVLTGRIADRLREVFEEVAVENDWDIRALAVQPDHVHLFVQADVRTAPFQVVRAFKGRSSRVLRDEFPSLLRLPSLWTRAYFCGTSGKVSDAIIKQYIDEQS